MPVGGKTTRGAVRRQQQGLCQTVKFIRMTMYPKERGRTAGRAYIWCARTVTTIDLFIPCNVITTCSMWEHRQKCASLKVSGVMPGRRLFVRCCAVAVRTWNHRQRDDMLPCTTDQSRDRCGRRTMERQELKSLIPATHQQQRSFVSTMKKISLSLYLYSVT
ncbi:hypothetical protein D3C79_319330 [compost metagenome]